MTAAVAGALPLTGEATALVDTGEDGGVDWKGERLRNVDSWRLDGIVIA